MLMIWPVQRRSLSLVKVSPSLRERHHVRASIVVDVARHVDAQGPPLLRVRYTCGIEVHHRRGCVRCDTFRQSIDDEIARRRQTCQNYKSAMEDL